MKIINFLPWFLTIVLFSCSQMTSNTDMDELTISYFKDARPEYVLHLPIVEPTDGIEQFPLRVFRAIV